MDYTFNWTIVLSCAPAFVQACCWALGSPSCRSGSAPLSALCVPRRRPRVAADPLAHQYVEIFRNVPILLWTYFAFYGIGRLGFGVLSAASE